MKIKHTIKPYKGYMVLIRAMMYLFIKEKIDFSGLGAFVAFMSECDWDRKHPTYGCLTKTDEYLCRKWNCNMSTIWRRKKELVAKGLFIYSDEGYMKLKYPFWLDINIAKKYSGYGFKNAEEFIEITQEIFANNEEPIAKTQFSPDDISL